MIKSLFQRVFGVTCIYKIILLAVFLLCVSSAAYAVIIDDIPPEVRQQPSPPNMMIIVDDSDSMFSECLGPGMDGNYEVHLVLTPSGQTGYGAHQKTSNDFPQVAKKYWRFRWSGKGRTSAATLYNTLYYNPDVTYRPWEGMAGSIPSGTSISASSLNIKCHPMYSDVTLDLNAKYTRYGTSSDSTKFIKNAHYFVWSQSQSKPWLISLDYNGSTGSINYFRIDDIDQDDSSLSADTSNPSVVSQSATQAAAAGVKITRTYDQEIRNFANWYTFSRNRWLTSVNAITYMLPNMSGIQVGLWTINAGPLKVRIPVKKIRIYNTESPYNLIDESSQILNPLKERRLGGGNTPLRVALNNIGKYYSGSLAGFGVGTESETTQTTPLDQGAGGACQKNFVMLFTDGYYNDESGGTTSITVYPSTSATSYTKPQFDNKAYNGISIGDADTVTTVDTSVTPNVTYSGIDPFKDKTGVDASNTLADVAMYYYKTDLSPSVSNDLSTTTSDPAPHQHMITYTVGLGLSGTKPYPSSTTPTDWEKPPTTNTTPYKIDDLWHAAVNGRGEYYSASNPQELENAFANIASSIMSSMSSAASVAVNGTQVSNNLVFYQPMFLGSAWVGDVKAKTFPLVEGVPNQSANPDRLIWSANAVLSNIAHTSRKILTHNGTATSPGRPFRYASLTDSQKTALNSNEAILNYLRGDHSNEKRNGGTYRNRVFEGVNSKIGDIVHSTPFFDNGVIYAGANDGMLHAFRASDGVELFAYIPSFVFPNLKDLVDPNYLHKHFVDGSPYVQKVLDGSNVYRLLVGGLGYGGKGIFCLDVTNALGVTDEALSTGMVKWEFPNSSTAAEDVNDMGYSYSRPYIVKTYNPAHPYVVIFGNGYNSPNGNAVLFILDALTGEKIKKIDVGNGPDNGLSTPSIVDSNADGFADYVYAGDLQGNLWKFNIKNSAPDSASGTGVWGNSGPWRSAYGTSPLFTARFNSVVQPITGKPDVMLPCKTGLDGLMVVFGTGRFLSGYDTMDYNKQTIYGIWDYGDDADASENVGTFSSHTESNTLSNSNLTGVGLLQQTLATEVVPGTLSGRIIRVLSNNQPDWTTVDDGTQHRNPSVHAGWFLDLESTGERLVNDIVLNGGAAIFASTIPSVSSPCSSGGQSWLYEINACTGGRLKYGHFDVNRDRVVDDSDTVTVPDPANPGQTIKLSPSALYNASLMYTPVIVDDTNANLELKATSVGNATIELVGEQREKKGIYYWRSY